MKLHQIKPDLWIADSKYGEQGYFTIGYTTNNINPYQVVLRYADGGSGVGMFKTIEEIPQKLLEFEKLILSDNNQALKLTRGVSPEDIDTQRNNKALNIAKYMFKTVEEGALNNLSQKDKTTLYEYIKNCATYFKHYEGRTSYSIKHDLQKGEYNNLYVTNDQFKAAMLYIGVKVKQKKDFEQSIPGMAPIFSVLNWEFAGGYNDSIVADA